MNSNINKIFPAMVVAVVLMVVGCARMGQPDGGWYDETPPRILGSSPRYQATNSHQRRVTIFFDEYIKIDNATEKVVVSPPQLEQPEIKGEGKRIRVDLKDSLKPNTTYTIDFSDAISDNNEGNPLGNYTFSFSTGNQIDTLEASGVVLAADNLEPIKGILVGLYADMADSAFTTQPMLRVARTDSRGHFVIRGIKPGSYRVYALQDADGNYFFNQKSEALAFSPDTITPTCGPDIRQDTLWRDSLHIDSIIQTGYTHFYPDNIVLRAFTETQTFRYLVKYERPAPDHFTLFFSYGNDSLPAIKGLNFNADGAFIREESARRDTLTYWLRDTMLVNQDTLDIQLKYLASDSTGALHTQTDTLQLLSKESYERRLKQQAKDREDWAKKQARAKRRGEPYQEQMPAPALMPEYGVPNRLDPDRNLSLSFPSPLARIDTAKIHLYAKHDTLWYRAPFRLRADSAAGPRRYKLMGEWRPDIEYSLEIDSTAFTDIYGKTTGRYKQGFKVPAEDEYSSLLVTITGLSDTTLIAQLLDRGDNVLKQVTTRNGQAEFYYLTPGTYYLRTIVDSNGNGRWETGSYSERLQPEAVYYYPDQIECKAKWDRTLTWAPTALPLNRQKPGAITKQKGEGQKQIRHLNADRAQKLGIKYIPKL